MADDTRKSRENLVSLAALRRGEGASAPVFRLGAAPPDRLTVAHAYGRLRKGPASTGFSRELLRHSSHAIRGGQDRLLSGTFRDEFFTNVSESDELYQDLKERIDGLQKIISKEGEYTREKIELVHGDVIGIKEKEIVNRSDINIFSCFVINPVENIRILSKSIIGITLFSLFVSVVIGVHFLNPLFAALLFITAFGFFGLSFFRSR